MDREECRPFLAEPKNGRYSEEGESHLVPTGTRFKQSWLWLSAIANIALVVICTVLVFLLALKHHSAASIDEPYSPSNEAVKYEYRTMTANDTIMVGKPSPAWEEAMHGLLDGTLIRVTNDELALADADSVPLQDGGFAAGLGIGHNLHCVKKLKQFLYFDHFYPDVEVGCPHYDYLQYHADHCLDFIRQSMMCHMDFSLYTLVWAPGEDGSNVIKHKNPGVQKCVNWDSMQGWMQARAARSDMIIKPS